MTTRSKQREQFLTDILITAVESGHSGIGYWAEVSNYNTSAGTVTVWDAEDNHFGLDDDSPDHYDVTLDTIEAGLKKLLSGDVSFYPSGYENLSLLRLADETDGNEGDYDAEIADAILQLGLFGEVVFG